MKVLDASALLELVVGTSAGLAVADELEDPGQGVHIPHLADVEVVTALRRLVADDVLSEGGGREALAELQSLDFHRHGHDLLLGRVWDLRRNVSSYDAVYVALAEVLDAELVTCDRRLARSPKLGVKIKLIGASRR